MKISLNKKTWNRAKQLIPNGTMLLSKNPDVFLPSYWPTYFSKAKGCHVWDLENNKYLDFSLMGVGTNILGYSHSKVNKAVIKAIKNGNMSTLNCKEEVDLGNELIKIHPWAKMVRFARTGGEANSIAIRIARSSLPKKKYKIAFCGYHGWHDWYLASNIKNQNKLENFLMKGIRSKGVPDELKNSIIPFYYNDVESLKKILSKNKDIGIIILEPYKDSGPKKNFLKKVREIATKNKIILIFDECTTGFRNVYGGIHLKYKINPDLAMFGKALGNGHAITAVIGKKNIMKNTNQSFISSTFWTERSGPAAALATLKEMKRIKSWNKINRIGSYVKKNIIKIAKKNNLEINLSGYDGLIKFNFPKKNNLYCKTYLTQEMLENNILATNAIYISIEHKLKYIRKYLNILEKVFFIISSKKSNEDIRKLIHGKICKSDFRSIIR